MVVSATSSPKDPIDSSYFSTNYPNDPTILKRVMLVTAKRLAMKTASQMDFINLHAFAVLSAKSRPGFEEYVPKCIGNVETVLICLEDESCPDQEIVRAWRALPKPLQDVFHNFDEGKPRDLLLGANERGYNRVEALLECLHGIRESSISDEGELASYLETQMKERFESPAIVPSLNKILDTKFMDAMSGLFPMQISMIPNERVRIALVKDILEKDKTRACQFRPGDIKDYEILSEEARIEIAELAAQQNGFGVSMHIREFDISSEEARLKIAILAAKQDRFSVCEHILNYDLSEESRIKIAILIAQQGIDAEQEVFFFSTRDPISKHIQHYQIKDQRALVKIAMLVAQMRSGSISASIDRFKIQEEADRIEIAKVALQREPVSLCREIRNYQISNQRALVEIAKLVCYKDARLVSDYINNFQIDSKADRVEIAKTAAQNFNGHLLRLHMSCTMNYRIDSSNALAISAIGWLQFAMIVPAGSVDRELGAYLDDLSPKWSDPSKESALKRFLTLDDHGYETLLSNLKGSNEARLFAPLFYLTWFEEILERHPASETTFLEILRFRNPQIKFECGKVLQHLYSTGRLESKRLM